MNAVRTPGGSSAAVAVRASVSIASMKIAPNSVATGSKRANRGPVTIRAMCGTTSPTQPMIPQTATLAAVATRRRGDDDRAQARRVHAERARLVLGQRQQVDAPRQAFSSREREDDRDPAAATWSQVAAARLPISQNVIAGSWL